MNQSHPKTKLISWKLAFQNQERILTPIRVKGIRNLRVVDASSFPDMISGNINASIYGTSKFFKEQTDEKKENIYSNIDDMLNQSLKSEED